MFDNIINLFDFIDDTVKKIYRKHPDEIKCRPGCADCCHASFDISFIEAAYLASFLEKNQTILKSQHEAAQKSAIAYEEMLKKGADPATTRIRCPLLDKDDLCLAHSFRPINCRTYGTPTLIDGKTHVCGLSDFNSQGQYATIDLIPLQNSLQRYSIELVGKEFGSRRYPIAWVLLKIEFFLPKP